jgi:hypothetical protein
MAQSIDTDEHHSDRTVVEARQGMTLGRMRYVLGISTALVVAAFVIIMAAFYLPS